MAAQTVTQQAMGNLLLQDDVIIIFDLETTGLIEEGKEIPNICQIAAQVIGEDEVWSRYMIPTIDIEPGASSVNKLQIENRNGSRVMIKDGEMVEAFEYKAGLGMFYEYLHEKSHRIKKSGSNSRIILVAHNGKRFDVPILINAFEKIGVLPVNLDKMNIVYADSKLILRETAENMEMAADHPLVGYNKYLKGGSGLDERPYSLASLHQYFCHDSFPAHDACEDVKALIRVLQSALPNLETVIAKNTF